MAVKEYDIVDDKLCGECGDNDDVVYDDVSGGYLCTQCVFEKECLTKYDEDSY